MRISFVLPIAAALTAVAIGTSGEAFATNRKPSAVVRDHRTPAPVVRDHRTTPAPSVRDHRTTPKVISVRPQGRKIIRADRNYAKVTGRKVVVVNGKRVVRKVDSGPVVRDHRTPTPVVRDHRQPAAAVRDHRVTPR